MKLIHLSLCVIITCALISLGCNKTTEPLRSPDNTSSSLSPAATVSTTAPVISFKISNPINDSTVLEGNVLKFTVTGKNIVSYLWNFGDGNTSSEAMPSEFYYTICSTTKTITLTVKNDKGETATYSKAFIIQCCRGFANHSPVTTPTHNG